LFAASALLAFKYSTGEGRCQQEKWFMGALMVSFGSLVVAVLSFLEKRNKHKK